jgi:hypothetical protein
MFSQLALPVNLDARFHSTSNANNLIYCLFFAKKKILEGRGKNLEREKITREKTKEPPRFRAVLPGREASPPSSRLFFVSLSL